MSPLSLSMWTAQYGEGGERDWREEAGDQQIEPQGLRRAEPDDMGYGIPDTVVLEQRVFPEAVPRGHKHVLIGNPWDAEGDDGPALNRADEKGGAALPAIHDEPTNGVSRNLLGADAPPRGGGQSQAQDPEQDDHPDSE